MSISIHKEIPSNVSTSGGNWHTTTTSKFNGLLRQIIIRANSESNCFDFYIKDENDISIFGREDVDGELNEQVCLPVKGPHTLTIINATSDEAFTVYLAIQEI